jgi:hypothetical protein
MKVVRYRKLVLLLAVSVGLHLGSQAARLGLKGLGAYLNWTRLSYLPTIVRNGWRLLVRFYRWWINEPSIYALYANHSVASYSAEAFVTDEDTADETSSVASGNSQGEDKSPRPKIAKIPREYATMAKAEFGLMDPTMANMLAVKSFIRVKMKEQADLRVVDRAKYLDMAVALTFVPLHDEIVASHVYTCTAFAGLSAELAPRGGYC